MATVHRSIQSDGKIFGFELFDLILFIITMAIFYYLLNIFIILLIVGIEAVVLLIIKKGKPPRYLESCVLYYVYKNKLHKKTKV